LPRLDQLDVEVGDAEARQRRLHPVDKAGLLTNQAVVLAARPLGVFLLQGLDLHHPAMPRLPAQPTQQRRISISVSTRSVLGRLCSRGTGTLAAWIT
jgi:hypothetical protein